MLEYILKEKDIRGNLESSRKKSIKMVHIRTIISETFFLILYNINVYK